jgi:hypothetical protein
MAHASWAAYQPQPGDWCQQLALGDSVTLITRDQFHAFLGSLKHTHLLAFRGTSNAGNFLTDAETPLVSHPSYPGRVHRGFAEAVDRLWSDIRRLVGDPGRCPPIWITGHSLGGAMATLASVRLAAEGFTIRGVYTFGSPRPGNAAFANAYDRPNYRFVNDNDLVPHLPFHWCYQHVGELKLFDPLGNIKEELADWHEKKLQLSRHAKRVQRHHREPADAPLKLTEFDWLADHYLGSYLAVITKALNRVPHRVRIDSGEANSYGIPAHFQRKTPKAAPAVARPAAWDGERAAGPAVRSRTNEATTPLERSMRPAAPVAAPTVIPKTAPRKKSTKLIVTDMELANAFFNQPPRPDDGKK